MDELPLTAEECRVLGSLIEKAATTPEQYPLSSNGLRSACNQKSARDPVVSYDERLVDATLLSLRDKGLARTIRGAGQRVFKHKHVVDETWRLDSSQLAVVAVLMLRGPQSAGELRTRTERAHGFVTTDGVEAVLDDLARRDPPLVRMIGRQPGQRDDRWATTTAPGDADDGSAGLGPAVAAASAPQSSPPAAYEGSTPAPEHSRFSASTSPVEPASADDPGVEALRREVTQLRLLVERVCDELGISIDEGAG
jgi:hypothetical protein